MKIDIATLTDDQMNRLIEGRWNSSSEIWDTVERVYKDNIAVYSNESSWTESIPFARKNYRIQANRVFVNMEAVINSLIANPPGLNILPSREGQIAQDFSRKLESFFRKKDSNSRF